MGTPITIPFLGPEEQKAASEVIASGWVTQGPKVQEFEESFAKAVNAPHACAVSSCTTALHLALLAVGVGPGDEVICPSHSFIATANSIRYCGAAPVFVDIELETFNISPELLEKAISSKTRAILCVHQMGMPCDMRAILEVSRKHGLPVIEDAACAIGSEIFWDNSWERIGKPHGDIACFSFHPRKVLTTGDGGMVTTRNKEYDAQFRLLRQHGMSMPDTVRHASNSVLFEEYPIIGFNYRMTDIQAAIGVEQLKRLDIILQRRREIDKLYRDGFENSELVLPPHQPNWARSNWQSYCVRLNNGQDQKQVMQELLDMGIATRRGIMCIHREESYRDKTHARVSGSMEKSETAQDTCILIPLFPQMSDEQTQDVVEKIIQTTS